MDTETRLAIAACVRSVEELEVLLYLARERGRYASAASIATEMGLPQASTVKALEAMASRNLLDVRIAGAVLYKLDPASDRSRACVERMLEAAWQDRTGVLKVILATRSAARDFADAFKVTQNRDDG